jgi:hypothetical protein
MIPGVLQHPLHSRDLAPPDSHLYEPLKEALKGWELFGDDEVKEVVEDWIKAQPKTFYYNRIRKLGNRWTKRIKIRIAQRNKTV